MLPVLFRLADLRVEWHTVAIEARAVPGQESAVLPVGLLFGGYSTFSTASVEGMRLLQTGRWRAALAHSGGMLVVSAAAAALGLGIGGALI